MLVPSAHLTPFHFSILLLIYSHYLPTSADIIAQKMKDMPVKLEEYYTNLRSRRMRTYDPLYVIRHGFDRMK